MDSAALAALARHGEAIATARAFKQRAGAQRVVLLLDRGGGEAAMIDCDAALHATEVTEGETIAVIPETAAVPVAPKPLPEIRATPASALTIDIDTGELAAPLGTVEHLASSVLALAREQGAAGMEVITGEDDTAARALYESVGFENEIEGEENSRSLFYELNF